MDRRLLEELIRDQERLLGIVTENLAKLRRLAGHSPGPHPAAQQTSVRADDLRRNMEAQRKEIWAKAEQAKQRAMAQAQQASGSMPTGGGIGGMMGGMGGMGMPNMPIGPAAKRLSKPNKHE